MTGLVVHRSHRVEDLADALVSRLGEAAPADPFRPATVMVGSRGMERWLRHRIATGLGVMAGIDFRFPGDVTGAVMSGVLGEDASGLDAWAPEPLAWSVLAAAGDLASEPAFSPVLDWLGSDAAGLSEGSGAAVGHRAWAWAREAADVLDRYAVLRPVWTLAWRRGEIPEELRDARDEPWQRLLWRRLAERLAPAEPFSVRAARVAGALRTGRARKPDLDDLHVFGVTALRPAFLELLGEVASLVRVDLYVFGPSSRFWGDLRTRASARRQARRLRDEDRDALARDLERELEAQNPLLTSLGPLSRDFQLVLEDLPSGYLETDPPAELPAAPPDTLLGWLQEDVRLLRGPAEIAGEGLRAARLLDPSDESVRVHACHGPTRQVEVLRDALLGLLADHPDLEPRDVLVMTPDVATFAPLVTAILSTEGAGAPRLPVHVADLGLRSRNPVADALLRVLEMALHRVTASGVLDLLSIEPVRRRFGLSEDDLPDLRRWTAESGARWGVDAADRARAGQPEDPQNTWLFGLERLALGAVAGDLVLPWEGVLPADLVEGAAAERLGRFLHFVRTVTAEVVDLREPRRLAGWAERLARATSALTLPADAVRWLAEEVHDALETLAEEARASGFLGLVAPDAVLARLEGHFDVPRAGDRPITGAVTVSALAPMRSVPYRVVALLGLDDGVFPRAAGGRSFDLTQERPRVGDRDPRDEDRHLFLEAVLSARSHLLVLYTGRDPRTGAVSPAAVPVAELLDVVDATCRLEDGRAPREVVAVEHPVVPWSTRAFEPRFPDPARPGALRPFSFDRRMLDAARRLAGTRDGRLDLFRGDALPAAEVAGLDLDDLCAVLRRPVRQLLRRRLGLRLDEREDDLLDREPIDLDGLEAWSLRGETLHLASQTLRTGGDPDWERIRARVTASGRLPLGAAGRLAFDRLRSTAEPALEAGAGDLRAGLRSVDVPPFELGGVRISGNVPAVTAAGEVFDLAAETPEKPRRLLAAWVRALALRASGVLPDATAVLHGTSTPRDRPPSPATLRLVPSEDAAGALADLVALSREALASPLPLVEKTSFAFAEAMAKSSGPWEDAPPETLRKARGKAEGAWSSEHERAEGDDPALQLVFRDRAPFETDGGEGVSTAFVRLAERLWRPLLESRSEAKP